MKRVFLSVPMKNRSNTNIQKSIDYMTDFVKSKYPEEELDIISWCDREPPSELVRPEAKSLWYLGQSLSLLSTADVFVATTFAGNYGYFGCKVEDEAAANYNIKDRYTIDIKLVCPDLFKIKE